MQKSGKEVRAKTHLTTAELMGCKTFTEVLETVRERRMPPSPTAIAWLKVHYSLTDVQVSQLTLADANNENQHALAA